MEQVKNLVTKIKGNWTIVFLCFMGGALRLYQITANDLWYDEICTLVSVTEKSHPFIDNHPGLYYFLIKIWGIFFGFNAFSSRCFSALWGILAIFFMYKVSELLFSKKTAFLATSFLVFSPFNIWYSQEARMFSLNLFLSLLASYYFIKSLKINTYRYWFAYFLSMLVCVFSTYYALLLLVPQAIIIAISNRKAFIKYLISVLLVLLPFILFAFPNLIYQFSLWRSIHWIPEAAFSNIKNTLVYTIVYFILGYSGQYSSYKLVYFLSILIFIYYLKDFCKNRLIAILLFIFPVILAYLVSKLIAPIYIYRNLIIISPFLYIILAESIISFKHSAVRAILIIIFCLAIMFSLVNYYNNKFFTQSMYPGVHIKKPIRPFVSLFLRNKESGDALGFSNFGFRAAFLYYLKMLSSDVRVSTSNYYFYFPGAESYSEKCANICGINGFLINLAYSNTQIRGIKRLWLFSASWSRTGDLDSNDRQVKEWLDQRFPRIGSWENDGVVVTLYNISN